VDFPNERALGPGIARQIGKGRNGWRISGNGKLRDSGHRQGVVVELRLFSGWHRFQIGEKPVPNSRFESGVLNPLQCVVNKDRHLFLTKIRPQRGGVRPWRKKRKSLNERLARLVDHLPSKDGLSEIRLTRNIKERFEHRVEEFLSSVSGDLGAPAALPQKFSLVQVERVQFIKRPEVNQRGNDLHFLRGKDLEHVPEVF